MKILILLLLLTVAAWSQELTPTVQTNVVFKPVVWQGDEAQIVAAQLMSITNAEGKAVVPAGYFATHSSTFNIRFNVATNGLQNITVNVR